MKIYTKYTLPASVIITSLVLTSCGEKNADEVASGATSKQEAQQVQGGEQAIKDALKSQVNATTADLMLKVPSFADMPPAQYEIPDNLENREMVQVSVKWPFISKYDLYELDSVLHELPNKPVVVKQVSSKGDELDYVEATFVLQADGGGGYIMQNSRFAKQGFSFGNYSQRDKMGKVTLIKGSDEHLEASKQVAEMRQAEEEKQRLEKLEAEKLKMAKAKAKIDELLSALNKEGTFEGALTAESNGRTVSQQFELTVEKVYEKAGTTFVDVKMLQYFNGRDKQIMSLFKGKFDASGELELSNIKPGRNSGYSKIWDLMDTPNITMTVSYGGHVDKIEVFAAYSRFEISGELIRQ